MMDDFNEHKNKKREDYDLSYEYFKYHGWKSVSDPDDLTYPKVISYIDIGDLKYFRNNGKKVDNKYPAKVAHVKEVSYDTSMDVKEAFKLIEDVFMTKQVTKGRRETLRASVTSLKDFEEAILANLLHAVREAYIAKEDEVLLTWSEYFLLKNGKFTKYKPKKGK